MKTLVILSLLFSLPTFALTKVCSDETGRLLLDLDSMTFDLDGSHGTLSKDGMNWAGQIYQLITEDRERMSLIPHHFDHTMSLELNRENIRTFTCD